MRNIRLVISYDGGLFFGSQSQKTVKTVQGEIEKALKSVTGKKVKLTLAGRTDRGVHAFGQVANFHTASSIPADRFSAILNNRVGDGIRVSRSDEVPASFDARRSAKKRSYVYYIYNGGFLPVLFWGRVLHIRQPLDLRKMRAAAKLLKGRHDFINFCAKDPAQKHYKRRVIEVKIALEPTIWGDLISINVSADSFLYKMVRSIVGTLIEAGKGKLSPSDVSKLLKGLNIKVNRPIVPPCGLYLSNVEYGV